MQTCPKCGKKVEDAGIKRCMWCGKAFGCLYCSMDAGRFCSDECKQKGGA
ncbi:MAG: hypothetical protein KAW41_01260 [Candidatus Diapherotrites archaeon]|nr:hypothetical protein [Candidatus Diapherotrites archaeon]